MFFNIFIRERGQNTDTVQPKCKIWFAFNIADDNFCILFEHVEGVRNAQ